MKTGFWCSVFAFLLHNEALLRVHCQSDVSFNAYYCHCLIIPIYFQKSLIPVFKPFHFPGLKSAPDFERSLSVEAFP